MMERREVLHRYRHLRAIGTHHHSAALKFLARPAIVEHARRLGLMTGQTLIADSMEELTLVFDLAIYTAKAGRSRAIDRYAKAAHLPSNTDEMSMLAAMCHARFSSGASNVDTTHAVSWSATRSVKPKPGSSMKDWRRVVRAARASPAGCARLIRLSSPPVSSCLSMARCSRASGRRFCLPASRSGMH
jgi:hypothetical protein